LGISAPIITRAADADTFKHRVMLRGVAPAAEHAGRFAVLLTPLPNGDVGHACVDGVCVAKVEMASDRGSLPIHTPSISPATAAHGAP
jgi:hypothetical protein